jgi:hypothetical protein
MATGKIVFPEFGEVFPEKLAPGLAKHKVC